MNTAKRNAKKERTPKNTAGRPRAEGSGAEKKTRRRALGRGLDALFSPSPAPASARPTRAQEPQYGDGAVFMCPVERVVPRKDQPRKRMDEQKLEELADSIRQHGVIEPIVVRRTGPGQDQFEIIAGERRWLATQRAGERDIPVVVKDVSSREAFELALVENLQREDLNPMEVAEAYDEMVRGHGYTQQSLAQRVGKSRVAVANAMRLLKLPEKVRRYVAQGVLSEGHARALLGAPDEPTMLAIAERAVRGKLPVRKVENLVRAAKRQQGKRKTEQSPEAGGKSAAVRDLEMRLTRRLGARSQVDHGGPGGKLTIQYASLDELDRIIELIGA